MKITIRTAHPEDAHRIARIHVESWQESYTGILSEDYLHNISFEERLNLRRRLLEQNEPKALHLVAAHENQIIGFCDVGASACAQWSGELYAIYLLNSYKRYGVGSKFMKQVFGHCFQYQLFPLVAWVLKKNINARQFYETHGGKPHQEETVEIGGQLYDEIAYVFGLPDDMGIL